MSEQAIGNDGLTDDERTALAVKYGRVAAAMTPDQVQHATIERIKARREALR